MCVDFVCVQFQELQMDREMLLTTNRSLAEESLARRPRLCNGKLQLAEKYRQLSNLATRCWDKQSQLGEFTAVRRVTQDRRSLRDMTVKVTGSATRILQNSKYLSISVPHEIKDVREKEKCSPTQQVCAQKVGEIFSRPQKQLIMKCDENVMSVCFWPETADCLLRRNKLQQLQVQFNYTCSDHRGSSLSHLKLMFTVTHRKQNETTDFFTIKASVFSLFHNKTLSVKPQRGLSLVMGTNQSRSDVSRKLKQLSGSLCLRGRLSLFRRVLLLTGRLQGTTTRLS